MAKRVVIGLFGRNWGWNLPINLKYYGQIYKLGYSETKYATFRRKFTLTFNVSYLIRH